jgi:hypothetical protein
MDPTISVVEVVRTVFPSAGWLIFMLYSVQHLCDWCETFNLIVYTQDWLAVRKIVTDFLSKIKVHEPGFPIGNCADFMLVVTVVLFVYRLTLHIKAERTILRLFIHTKGIAAAHRRMDEHEEFQSKKPASEETTPGAIEPRKNYSGTDFREWFVVFKEGQIRKQSTSFESLVWDFIGFTLWILSCLVLYLIMPNVLSASILEHARDGDSSEQLHFGLLWLLMLLLNLQCPRHGEDLRNALCMLLFNWSASISLHDLERSYNDGHRGMEFLIDLLSKSMVLTMVLLRAYGILPGDFRADFVVQWITIDHFRNPNEWKFLLKNHPIGGKITVVCILVFLVWRWMVCDWPYSNSVKTHLLLIPATRLQALFCWPSKNELEYVITEAREARRNRQVDHSTTPVKHEDVLFWWACVVLGVNVVILWKKIALQQKALKKKFKNTNDAWRWYVHFIKSTDILDNVILAWALYEAVFNESSQKKIFMCVTGKKDCFFKMMVLWTWWQKNDKPAIVSSFWNNTVTCTWELPVVS